MLLKTDEHYARAKDIYADLLASKSALITTNLVAAETCNWLLRNKTIGHQTAMHFRAFLHKYWFPLTVEEDTMLVSGSSSAIVYSSPHIEQAAWDILAKYDTAGFSFTDCVSFAVMQALGISTAFAFDRHFDVLGFQRL